MSLAIGNHRLPVTDETWPYPDREGELASDDDLDLDLLELRADLAATAASPPRNGKRCSSASGWATGCPGR